MFNLPRSSWDDYDRTKLSKGGGIYPRTQKSIELSAGCAQGARHRCRRDRPGDTDERDPQGARSTCCGSAASAPT